MPSQSSLLLILASILYSLGGIAMKYSQGFAYPRATLLVLVFFNLGALLQTWLMKSMELGVSYLLVVGLEGLFTLVAGVLLFQESLALSKLAGAFLVLMGLLLLKLE